jgi:hypothetical protein
MAQSHKQQLKKKQKQQKKKSKKMKLIQPSCVANFPVMSAWVSAMVQGIQMGCFVRRISADDYHVMMYLLDTWALGVKDSYVQLWSLIDYEKIIEQSPNFQRVEPGYLKLFIKESAAFGVKNGIEPIGKYSKMLPYLENIETEAAEQPNIEFGDNGRVVYIANVENETSKEIEQRLFRLKETLGDGNFDFFVPQL